MNKKQIAKEIRKYDGAMRMLLRLIEKEKTKIQNSIASISNYEKAIDFYEKEIKTFQGKG